MPGHNVSPLASLNVPVFSQRQRQQAFSQLVRFLSVSPSGFCSLPACPSLRVPVSAAEGPAAEVCSVPHQ